MIFLSLAILVIITSTVIVLNEPRSGVLLESYHDNYENSYVSYMRSNNTWNLTIDVSLYKDDETNDMKQLIDLRNILTAIIRGN